MTGFHSQAYVREVVLQSFMNLCLRKPKRGCRLYSVLPTVNTVQDYPKEPKTKAYSDTLLLPKTSFPLRTSGAKREEIYRKKTTEDLYKWQVSASELTFIQLSETRL